MKITVEYETQEESKTAFMLPIKGKWMQKKYDYNIKPTIELYRKLTGITEEYLKKQHRREIIEEWIAIITFRRGFRILAVMLYFMLVIVLLVAFGVIR